MADRECWLLGGKPKVKLPLYYYGKTKERQIPVLFQPPVNAKSRIRDDKNAKLP